jgi:hypothetical protein
MSRPTKLLSAALHHDQTNVVPIAEIKQLPSSYSLSDRLLLLAKAVKFQEIVCSQELDSQLVQVSALYIIGSLKHI